MIIRKAKEEDLDLIEALYKEIHDAEEEQPTTGWIRSIYPRRPVAEEALLRGDLFVLEDQGTLNGSAIINKTQLEVYKHGNCNSCVKEDQVAVLHTLVISPRVKGQGYGRAFVDFYEAWGRDHGCRDLRLDTNAKNKPARAMYKKLGFKEVAIVATVFNGIPGVDLVLLEKTLD